MSQGSGLLNTLRMVVSLAIVAIAALAIGLVLDVVPRETFQTLAVKVLMVAGIVIVVGAALALLMRKPGAAE